MPAERLLEEDLDPERGAMFILAVEVNALLEAEVPTLLVVFDLSFDATEMSIELKSGGPLSVTDAEGAVFAVAVGKKATLPAGEAAIRAVAVRGQ